jgi:hypothetical protein
VLCPMCFLVLACARCCALCARPCRRVESERCAARAAMASAHRRARWLLKCHSNRSCRCRRRCRKPTARSYLARLIFKRVELSVDRQQHGSCAILCPAHNCCCRRSSAHTSSRTGAAAERQAAAAAQRLHRQRRIRLLIVCARAIKCV